MTLLFILSVLLIVYTYAIFPLVLHWRARSEPALAAREPDQWPSVSIVIAAHNEAAGLPGKLESLDHLDYPSDKIEVIIVSDGSTDGTDTYLEEAFRHHPARHVIVLTESLGKCGALNTGVEKATGDIIVFMDARQRISSNALNKLIPFLEDPEIGAVSGELVLTDDEASLEAGNFGLYWRYEKWIRDNESRLFSTTGATGALYAIRRAEFTPNPLGTLLDDFNTPVELLRQGKRTLFVTGAYAFDKTNDNMALEFRRKVRNLAGNWQSFSANMWLFNPSKNPVWWQFLSHKVFRLLVPFAMIGAFVACVFGEGWLLNTMLVFQLLFYGVAAASYFDLPGTRNKVCNIVQVFIQLNAAAFMGTVRYFINPARISWR